jgi:hypothetical protein
MSHPAQDIPDDILVGYINDLGEMAADNEYWDTQSERDVFLDRKQELQEELDSRNANSNTGSSNNNNNDNNNNGNNS